MIAGTVKLLQSRSEQVELELMETQKVCLKYKF